jgi:hypothetical protein
MSEKFPYLLYQDLFCFFCIVAWTSLKPQCWPQGSLKKSIPCFFGIFYFHPVPLKHAYVMLHHLIVYSNNIGKAVDIAGSLFDKICSIILILFSPAREPAKMNYIRLSIGIGHVYYVH